MARSGPAKPRDPETKGKGDGVKAAFAQKTGTERGKPAKGKNPDYTAKSDGMKVAMKGEASKKGSKLTSMKAAEKRVR
jgi:hypothetical protein